MASPYHPDIFEQEALTAEEAQRASSKQLPLTFGFEIEQPDFLIPDVVKDSFEWHYDGSGPLETKLLPSKHPVMKVREFVK